MTPGNPFRIMPSSEFGADFGEREHKLT